MIAESRRDAAGARAHRARRPVGRERPDHRRERHAARASSRARSTPSRRARQRPLVTLNAGGISEGVFESELFGHVKGAFTDATRRPRRPLRARRRRHALPRRDRATCPPSQQAQAAARPRDRRVRARRLLAHAPASTCASSRRPTPTCAREVAAGRFRQDLLFRLNTIEIHVPAAARAPRGHPARSPSTSCGSTRSATARPIARLRAGRARRRCSTIPGRATSASSTTPSSARVLMAPGDAIRAGGPRPAPRRRRGAARSRSMTLEDVEGLLIQKAHGPLRRQRQPGGRGARPLAAARSTAGSRSTASEAGRRSCSR